MKVVLTIAGSDSSGGAGLQADLKTFEAFGVYGASVVTVLTAQNTTGVSEIFPVDAEFVKAQLDAVFSDFDVSAVKIGMLYSNEIIDVVREYIKELDIPVVFDPVFISKAGSKLLSDDAVQNMKTILPYATVATPNQYEAKEMFGDKDAECAVVVKNNIIDAPNHQRSVDTLYKDGQEVSFDTPYRETNNTHGTGCSFSSAIAANLALGLSLEESIGVAKKFIYLSIKSAPNLGYGKGPIAHKVGGEICHAKEN